MNHGDERSRRARPGPKRGPSQPAGRAEVRRAVLDAAAALFGREGVSAVSIRDIAAEADVHPALVGRYVGRREKLIDAVYIDLTEQLVSEIEEAPLRARSFERNSVMGRWTVLIAYYSIHGLRAPAVQDNPVTALAHAIELHYGSDSRSARWRAAQIVGSAVGWRLLEAQLVHMGGPRRSELAAVRADLNLLHNIAGSLPLPTPDPRPD